VAEPELELDFVFAGAFGFGAGGLGGAGSLCGALRYISASSALVGALYVFAEALAAFVFFGAEAPA
jgi:hypothetical protein